MNIRKELRNEIKTLKKDIDWYVRANIKYYNLMAAAKFCLIAGFLTHTILFWTGNAVASILVNLCFQALALISLVTVKKRTGEDT